jgi:uncharacterized protein (TIGR03435 family)
MMPRVPRFIAGVILAMSASSVCVAQPAASPPAFEVASLKAAIPGPQGVWTNGSPDRIRMLNMSLKELISFAYDVKGYQLPATGWVESEKYDVIAKVSPEIAALPWEKKFALERVMTQALLAERFKLAVHREKKDLPVYGLAPVKSGSKIHQTGPNPGDNVNVDFRRGHISAKSMPMSQLVEILADQLDRPVLDLTGITGVFDISLDWAPENADPNAIETKPPLPLALEDQLGLKLETRKGAVEVLVIDHAERAAAN